MAEAASGSHVPVGAQQPAAPALSAEVQRRFAEQPYNRYMGLELVQQADGYCRVTLCPSPTTPRGAGNGVHGGILASLVDIVALGAIHSAVGPNDVMAGTAELNISYLRPAAGALVVAEARVLKKGRSLVGVDVDISDGSGRLFCKGRVLYALRQRET